MNRKTFLRTLCATVAAVAVTPKLIKHGPKYDPLKQHKAEYPYKPEDCYTIGLDWYNGVGSYCLIKRTNNEIVAINTLTDKGEFEAQVKLIADYYNATIIKETL